MLRLYHAAAIMRCSFRAVSRRARSSFYNIDRFKDDTRPFHVRCWQHFSPVQAPPRTESWVICWSLAAMSLRMSL